LLVAGIPLVEGLRIIKGLTDRNKLTALEKAIAAVNDGSALSEALGELLPIMACGAIVAAERAGELEDCLGRLAVYYENKAELQEKLISSLIYPVFVLSLCLVSLLAMIFFVLPGLRSLFVDLNAPLPPVTSWLLDGSDRLSRNWLALLAFAGSSGCALILWRRRQPLWFELSLLKIPLAGSFYWQELEIQTLAMLGSLLRGGTPILEALRITAGSSHSLCCRQAIEKCALQVADGVRVSDAFTATGFFRLDTIRMIGIGEGSGQLAEMLVSSADFQARQREMKIKRLTTLLEPALTLTVGGAVALIVLAMFLPLVNMIAGLQ
jgi:type IV pilus assembly protein PilC